MPVTTERSTALADLAPDGWELLGDTAAIQRYADGIDLPGPVHGIGPKDGPITAAWCPHCLEPVDGWQYDSFAARPRAPFTVPVRHLAALLTLPACGHAFRIQRGQTIFEIQEPAA